MAFTVAGLILNTVPEWQIVTKTGLLPTVAFWSGMNVVVLFLVCMMSLQAPLRRAEERFQIEEPIWLFGTAGTLSTGRTKDFSLSGVGIVADTDRALTAKVGDRIRLYITEVGFIAGTVVRLTGRFLSVHFDLPPCVERDLLIRKLFTGGLDAATVTASGWSATGAMLRTIWSNRTALPAPAPTADVAALPPVKLPARSFVMAPKRAQTRLAELSAERRRFAA